MDRNLTKERNKETLEDVAHNILNGDTASNKSNVQRAVRNNMEQLNRFIEQLKK